MSKAFYSVSDFKPIEKLEAQWRDINREFEAVKHELIDYVERNLFDEGWKVFGLWNLPHREPIFGAIEKCPLTAALITQHIPHHGAAGFSVLMPGTRIKPHVGWQGQFLRCHIGLDIPDGDCAIRVAGETRSWAQGQALIFNDRLEHEAWNASSRARTVLLFDFDPAEC
jgi:beta-hydroxylase